MLKLLKKYNSGLTDSSLKTYERNIRRLSKLADKDNIPISETAWILSEKLINKVKKLNLNQRRLLTIAAVKFLQTKPDLPRKKMIPWVSLMNKASDQYSKKRSERKLSKKEISKIPKNGWADYIRLVKYLVRSSRYLFRKPVEDVTKKKS